MVTTIFDEGRIFDVIIAGAGPGGCVLAGRLSEQPDRQILLIEAGPDVAVPGAEHPDILHPFALTASNNREFHWPGIVAGLGAGTDNSTGGKRQPYVQGYGVGGASNINGMGADRGQPGDFDEWRDLGANDWGWEDVLPYFIKLERDLDFSSRTDPLVHGSSGPMPVRRLPRARWAPFAAAIGDALQSRGFAFLEDYNADFSEGFSAAPTNSLLKRRISASMAYLPHEVRQRPNLTILANARVDKVSLEGRQANGVFVCVGALIRLVRGRQIILSCGAIQSPALLMRSGIGPAAQLLTHGIEIKKDLPGVGANLQNHPYVSLVVYLGRGSTQPSDNPWFLQNWLRFSSRHPGCAPCDMHLMPFNKCAWHTLGRRVGAVVLSVFKPYSKGRVELSCPHPEAAPKVDFNLLGDPRDSGRLVSGLRFALELTTDAKVMKGRGPIFFPDTALVASLNQRSAWNAFRAWAMALALDRQRLRRPMLARRCIDPQALLADEDSLVEFVHQGVQPQYHVCGTCRMGRGDDKTAVVDSIGRVHGIEGLRVVDASIFPSIPRANTHFTVLMVAEKIADVVKGEWHSLPSRAIEPHAACDQAGGLDATSQIPGHVTMC